MAAILDLEADPLDRDDQLHRLFGACGGAWPCKAIRLYSYERLRSFRRYTYLCFAILDSYGEANIDTETRSVAQG